MSISDIRNWILISTS